MDHKLNNVQALYDSSYELYNTVVKAGDASADSIIFNLYEAIENLKNCWKGIDAGKNIQRVIEVHNEMVKVRNALATLAQDSSGVAVTYRDIQNSNNAGLEYLTVITTDQKQELEAYSDTADTIDIVPEAERGKTLIDTANTDLSTFISNVNTKYTDIMDNWTAGTGRENADSAYREFISNVRRYQNNLTEVSESITSALKNYTF